jgi:hypothetical protein
VREIGIGESETRVKTGRQRKSNIFSIILRLYQLMILERGGGGGWKNQGVE